MPKTFTYNGRSWACGQDPSGYWLAALQSPHSVVSAPTWPELVEAIKAFDPDNPRVDAVAICDPLPPMGSKAGF